MKPMHLFRVAMLAAVGAIAAHAGDGVTEINHARALAGGITPGDSEGYPITLSQPGSYRLTGNLTLPDANTNGIRISADHITVDLNGFEIIGPAECTLEFPFAVSCTGTGGGHGIVGAPVSEPSGRAPENILIRNGTIRGAGANGIYDLFGRVERVRLLNNGGLGVQLASGGSAERPSGGNAVVESLAIRNGLGGIFAGDEATGNIASFNGGIGISCGDCVMSGNSATNNVGSGLDCNSGVVRGNRASGNGMWGLDAGGCGYAENFLGSNGSGSVTGGTEIGVNLCDADTTCP